LAKAFHNLIFIIVYAQILLDYWIKKMYPPQLSASFELMCIMAF